MRNEEYKETVDLLLEALPYVLVDKRVALKGGTAINLFHRDFPRFSVDIDLCYLPLEDRETTFKNLHGILKKIKVDLESRLGFIVNATNTLEGTGVAKLIASKANIQIKVEPNFVIRGSLFAAVDIALSQRAQIEFGKQVTAQCLNVADSYGGKICAALDRQHPRDLFDVKLLLKNEGITEEVKDSFIFYLISHNRPINELLDPRLKDINSLYEREFVGMAKVDVSIEELLCTRKILIVEIIKLLNENDRKFLVSFVSNTPEWTFVRDSKIKNYPSVQWKLMNQEKMEKDKRDGYVNRVREIFKNLD